jgi:hypothetical protein
MSTSGVAAIARADSGAVLGVTRDAINKCKVKKELPTA